MADVDLACGLAQRTGRMVPRSKLPVYARQLFPETVIGEKPADRQQGAGDAHGEVGEGPT